MPIGAVGPAVAVVAPAFPDTPLPGTLRPSRRNPEARTHGSAQRSRRFERRRHPAATAQEHLAVPHVPDRYPICRRCRRHPRIGHTSAGYQQVSPSVRASA